MAQILDLGNVTGPQGPAGPNEISEATATALTGVLVGANGKVAAVRPSAEYIGAVDKTGDTMTGALTVPELKVSGNGKLSGSGQTVTLAATTANATESAVRLNAKHVVSGNTTDASVIWEVGNYIATLYPTGTHTSAGNLSGKYLGYTNKAWAAVYATNGVIQTSDRASKDDIRYVLDESAPMALSLDEDTAPATPAAVTVGDVMDFVRSLAPVTFCYKNGAESASEATARPESIQLGLIADDIKTHPLFKYIGVKNVCEEVIAPAEQDEAGNVLAEAVTQVRTSFGLQAIPLATVALTACKKLTEELDGVNARLAALEEQMALLLSKDV